MFSKRSRPALLCILIAIIYSNAVTAAEIIRTRGTKNSVDTISITGDIEFSDADKFRNIAITSKQANVFLNSPGGRLTPALEIGRIIRIKGFYTVVQTKRCVSSCALIWIAGKKRSILDHGSVGFHGVYVVEDEDKAVPDNVGNARVGSYLTEMGFGSEIVTFATVSDPDGFKWMTPSVATSMNLPVTFVADRGKSDALELFHKALEELKKDKPNYSTAAGFYRSSADLSYAGSLNNLGDLYEDGKGVQKDKLAAVYYYTRAAERGEPTAYFSLATILADESKDQEVLTEALKFAILANQNLPKGFNRYNANNTVNRLITMVPKTAVIRANKLAKEWNPLMQEKYLMGDKPVK